MDKFIRVVGSIMRILKFYPLIIAQFPTHKKIEKSILLCTTNKQLVDETMRGNQPKP